MPAAASATQRIFEEAMQISVYVHIPFCRARCSYCDFSTYAGIESLIPAYAMALCREIESASERWGRLAVTTIYFGGGTPSLLPCDLLVELLCALNRWFHVLDDAEVSLEANPGTIDADELYNLRRMGVNRLSLGVQSTHAHELGLLGRIHTWPQAVETVKAARDAGFDNLNLDFIFGLPGQTLLQWNETLKAALRLQPDHLSLYGLTIEKGTLLERRCANRELPKPDEDTAAEMYSLAERTLAQAGFFHYEISNWARANLGSRRPASGPEFTDWQPQPPAFHRRAGMRSEEISPWVCRHNLTYWRNEPWLGIGAGAHSWLNGQRWSNVSHPLDYIESLKQGSAPVDEIETIERRLEMGETMMLGLRLAEGVDETRFHARFGTTLGSTFGEELSQLRDMGLLEWNELGTYLTPRGRLLGNQVFMQFV
jgi:oxygen-independent coproporphyrinogen-3 oxidase